MEKFFKNIPFRSLFDNSKMGIIIFTLDGKIEGVNFYLASLLGYDITELVGINVNELLPNLSTSNFLTKWTDYMKDPVALAMGESGSFNAIQKGETVVSIELSLSPFEIDGKPYLVSIINDITERKKLNKKYRKQYIDIEKKVDLRTKELSHALLELNHTNQNLEHEIKRREKNESKIRQALEKEKELNSLKSRLVSMASHEFRTPLGGIMTSASLLEGYTTVETEHKRSKHLKTIKKCVSNLTTILNDFLSLDKLDQGKIGTHPSSFEIIDFVRDVISEFEEAYEITNTINYKNLGHNINLFQDNDMLRNILVNLLSNAVKYSPPKSLIKVSTEEFEGKLRLIVEDHGVGIPENEQKNLFQSFFRASNVATIQGTGLGLCIIKKYLEFMGGSVEVHSKLNIGTTFEILIPLEIQNEKNTCN